MIGKYVATFGGILIIFLGIYQDQIVFILIGIMCAVIGVDWIFREIKNRR